MKNSISDLLIETFNNYFGTPAVSERIIRLLNGLGNQGEYFLVGTHIERVRNNYPPAKLNYEKVMEELEDLKYQFISLK